MERLESKEDEEPVSGEILFCGTTSWETFRDKKKKVSKTSLPTSLPSPNRLAPLLGVPIVYVATGSCSSHCVAVDVEGRTYTWGLNKRGQLGQDDLFTRNSPTIVTKLTSHKVVKASTGRHHTVVVTADGQSFGFGFNKHGQLGTGFCKVEIEKSPVKSLVTDATFVSCGSDFTIWLTSISGASIVSAGLPQYGQLGHGTDNEYNIKQASVKLVYEAQPRPRAIAALSSKNITKVTCGNTHTVAVDSEGFVYTWGYGGNGRLGHRVQKDEWLPRLVETFQRGMRLPSTAVIAAGSSYSAATASGGQLYMWGQVGSSASADDWMYPKPVFGISGWAIRSLACGYFSRVAAAEESCISWGKSEHGELGFGPAGPKQSSMPRKIDTLEGCYVISVGCGLAHTLFIVDSEKSGKQLKQMDVFKGAETFQVTSMNGKGKESAFDKKRKASARGQGKEAKKKKQR